MANERKTGLVVPNGLLRRTTRLDDAADPTALEGADEGQGGTEGDGEGRAPKVRRSRKIVKTADAKIEGRKIYLSDDLYDRLRLLAIQRRANVSAVVAAILDREVPRFELTRVEK